jgi:hypothetical protein
LPLFAAHRPSKNDRLTQVNKNPNAPEEVQSSQLFTNAVIGTMANIRGTNFEHGMSGVWDQHYAELQYAEDDLNQPRNSTIEGYWAIFYAGSAVPGELTGSLEDYMQILRQSTEPLIVGPTLVMRAFMVETMTDLWGSIPFTEAGRGSENLTPAYDAQQVVYDSLFASLDQAASIMSAIPAQRLSDDVEPRFGLADPVFGVNGEDATTERDSWVRLANSIHARAAMRISEVDPGKAQAELTKALSGPVISSNAENAFITWPGGVVANPLCLNWFDMGCGGTRDDQRVSERFVDTLKVTNDPRLAAYAEPTGASQEANPTPCDITYRGFPNGHASADVTNPCDPDGKKFSFSDYSRPTATIRGPNSPSIIMTYAEMLFIQAEAAERGMISGSAAQFYYDGIRASMEQWGIDAATADAYIAQAGVQYKGGTAGINQIAYEKWVALFNQETEAYSEWRRLDYPVLVPGPDAVTATVPTRLPYPDIENSLNATNLAAAKSAQGDTDITGHVWWDVPRVLP